MTPRGGGCKRRPNGPRGYGQGGKAVSNKSLFVGNNAGSSSSSSNYNNNNQIMMLQQQQINNAAAAKPVKYRIQGGQRPLKITVNKSGNENNAGYGNVNAIGGVGVGGAQSRAENIGNLIGQGYSSGAGGENRGPQLISLGGGGGGGGGNAGGVDVYANMNSNNPGGATINGAGIPPLLSVDKASNVGRNRSLPSLQQIKPVVAAGGGLLH